MRSLSRNMFLRLAMLVFVVACVATIVLLRLNNNEKMAKVETLREQVASAQDYVNELQADIDKPFDEDYVSEIARKKLGLRYPQEVIFYSDKGN